MRMIFKALFFLCLIFNNGVFASGIIDETDIDNLYMVRNIDVYSKSTTAIKAKEEALKNGQKQALKVIFERANIKPEYTKYVNDLVVAEMIESIQIKNEMMTKDSYSSVITVLFNKKFLNFHLKRLKIGVGSTVDDVFLYIPILEVDGKLNITDSSNSWYIAAYDDFFENSYENIFIIDNFDLANTALFSKKILEQNDYNLYNTLLKKYTANVVVVSIASYNSKNNTIDVIYREIDAEKTVEKKLSYSNKDELSLNEFYRDASVRFLQSLHKESRIRVSRNKNDTKILEELLKDNVLEIYIAIQNLKDYDYMKNLILNLGFVKRYETVEFSTKMAMLRLYYGGDESEIFSMFRNKGFELKNNGGKYFINYRGFD
jgi:hypothetical protein